MGAFDAAFRSLATSIVGAIDGPTLTITRKTATYSLTAGTESGATDTDDTATCSPPYAYSVHEIDGTNILQGDMKVIVDAASLSREPTPETDHCIINSIRYKIISVTPYPSGDQVAAYELQLRR